MFVHKYIQIHNLFYLYFMVNSLNMCHCNKDIKSNLCTEVTVLLSYDVDIIIW